MSYTDVRPNENRFAHMICFSSLDTTAYGSILIAMLLRSGYMRSQRSRQRTCCSSLRRDRLMGPHVRYQSWETSRTGDGWMRRWPSRSSTYTGTDGNGQLTTKIGGTIKSSGTTAEMP